MSSAQLEPFMTAMERGDPAALTAALAPGIVLNSPILADPIVGRERVLGILSFMFGVVEDLSLGDVLVGPDRYAVPLTASVGDHRVEGMEYLHLDCDGLVDVLTVLIRPLDGLVAFQNRLAPVIGMPELSLSPSTAAVGRMTG